MLPPRRPSSTISESLAAKVVISLSTRFNKPQNIIRQHFAIENVEQWARVRRLEGGDDMNASSFAGHSEDRRDATYVRVSSICLLLAHTVSDKYMVLQYDMLVDIHANKRRLAPKFEVQTFSGQLEHILVVRLPATPQLALDTGSTLILAGIRQCEVNAVNSMGMPFYSKMGRFEVVDMTCVQCLVRRVENDKWWAIIDRSGGLQRSCYAADE